MRLHHTLIAQLASSSLGAALLTAPLACRSNPPANGSSNAGAAQESGAGALPAAPDPLASLAPMIGGEWQTPLGKGTIAAHTYHWGPGRHSLRRLLHFSDEVIYWHPGRKELRVFGVSDWARGVYEGTMTVEGDRFITTTDMFQTHDHRYLMSRWTFDGPDKYLDELLERLASGDYGPLTSWTFTRSPTSLRASAPAAVDLTKLSERLKPFAALLGPTWSSSAEARGAWAANDALAIESTFQWVAGTEGIYARVIAPNATGEPTHLLDAFLYHHTGANTLRCLALSHTGGVYEGDISVLEGGALSFDLKGYEGDRVAQLVARVDFERDGSVRWRLWTVTDGTRTLMLDGLQRKSDA